MSTNDLDVGGKGTRGGLLCPIPGCTTGWIHILLRTVEARSFSNPQEIDDRSRLIILKGLCSRKLLLKQDVKNMNLLSLSCNEYCRHRFHYLASLDPTALKAPSSNGKPLIHSAIRSRGRRGACSWEETAIFEMVLKCGMKYYPSKSGFLFRKYKGKIACEAAIQRFGVDKVMACIKRCIPNSEELPILHHVLAHAPNLFIDCIATVLHITQKQYI